MDELHARAEAHHAARRGTGVCAAGVRGVPHTCAAGVGGGGSRAGEGVVVHARARTHAAAPVGFVAKSELQRPFLARIFLRGLGTQFVERFDVEKSVEDSARLVARAKAGQSLFVFAEGTLTRAPGLMPFKMGAFQVAAEAGVPVVPIAIIGTRSALRGGNWFPPKG